MSREVWPQVSGVIREHSTTFWLGTCLMRGDRRRAARAIYAACRIGDDAADLHPRPREAVAHWQTGEADLHADRRGPGYRRLMEDLAREAEHRYERGLAGLPHLRHRRTAIAYAAVQYRAWSTRRRPPTATTWSTCSSRTRTRTPPSTGEAERDRVREFVLADLAAKGVDLRGSVVLEDVIDPPRWAQEFSLERGATFGLSHGVSQVGWLRPHNKDDRLDDLYYVGSSTHPGAGVPMVMLSARLVTERIVEERPPAQLGERFDG